MNAGDGLPPFGVVQQALRRTTERLARELHTPSEAPPDWNEIEWSMARAVSAIHGITTLLANRLRWSGPAEWLAFLRAQRGLAQQRDARIATQLARIDSAMRAQGVYCVGLKGAALRQLSLYRDGERPMGDIDLLVRPQDAARTEQALHAIEYRRVLTTRRHVVYDSRATEVLVAFGEHPGNSLKIEVHQAIDETLPIQRVDITADLLAGDRPGINAYPDEVELMRHLLLHAAGNMCSHTLRQVQLQDIGLLGARFGAGDWQRLLNTPEARGGAWWMFPPLAMAARYDSGIPAALVQSFAARCPRLLRLSSARQTLSDISLSNLRIHALPGIFWSRSPLEALRFAHSRLLPDRAALEELRHCEAANPTHQGTPWYGIPHAHRIVKWLLSRPPRVQTMVSVRAALTGGFNDS